MTNTIKTLLFPFYLMALILLSVFLYLLSLLPRFFSGRYYHYLSRLWCRIFLHVLRIDLSIVYKNEQALPGHYVLVSNHPSFCEDFAIPAFFDIYPLAKAGVRDWFILGRISDYAGTIFVKRDSQDSRHAAMQSLVDGAMSGKTWSSSLKVVARENAYTKDFILVRLMLPCKQISLYYLYSYITLIRTRLNGRIKRW